MALNTSGTISLAGTTTGQSIEIELGGNGTTQISMNDTNVRTLSGTSAGTQLAFGDFYGKSNTYVATLTPGDTLLVGGKITDYWSGYWSSASVNSNASSATALGSLSVTSFNGATIVGVYGHSLNQAAGSYQYTIEVTGNRAASFVNTVSINGTSLGTIGTATYNATPNTTSILVGPATANNVMPGAGGAVTLRVT